MLAVNKARAVKQTVGNPAVVRLRAVKPSGVRLRVEMYQAVVRPLRVVRSSPAEQPHLAVKQRAA